MEKDQIVEWIIAGITKGHIRSKLMEDHGLTYPEAEVAIAEALNTIRDRSEQDPSVIIANHNQAYEKIIRYFSKIGYASGKQKAMKAKEKLLGILKDAGQKVTLNGKVVQTITRDTYDENRLSPQEQARLKELMGKMRVVSN